MLQRSAIPLYFQIANELEARIRRGEIVPGDVLPSEKELARQFGVSLITVRAGMRTLADKGLVARRRGKGTFVLGRNDRAVWGLGWLNDLITSVLPSRLEILRTGFSLAPLWIATRFGIRPDEPIYAMRTVRRDTQRNDQPFMTTEIFLPTRIGKILESIDIDAAIAGSKLMIMVVEEKCGIHIGSVRQTMTAELADSEISQLLALKRGEPLLVVTRDYFDRAGELVQVGRSWYRTDNYEYLLNLTAISRQIEINEGADLHR